MQRPDCKSEMTLPRTQFNSPLRKKVRALIAAAAIALTLGACSNFTQIYQRGYVLPDGALEQIPMGATQEQVLIVLGTPSTVATVSGEVFYYISQRGEQSLAFMQQKVIEQRVVAVYFDKSRRVERLADYGMKDGKIFDYISRTTPASGQELTALSYLFRIFTNDPR